MSLSKSHNVHVPPRIIFFLIVGLIALSQSANIIRIADANPIAITAWRLVLSAILLAPLGMKKLGTLKRLSKVDWMLLLGASVALSLHFFSWIFAVQYTTVANATLFFSINPVTTALGAYLLYKEKAGKRLLVSIGLGVIGVGIIGGNDLSLKPEHLIGDGGAMMAALLFSAYFLVAKRIRQKLDADVYVTVLYGGAAILSTVVLIGYDGGFRVDYTGSTWLCFFLMAVVPTMIGHSSLNAATKYMAAGRISAYTLIEPLFAGIVAYYAWNETISEGTVIGYGFISASVLVLVLERFPFRVSKVS